MGIVKVRLPIIVVSATALGIAHGGTVAAQPPQAGAPPAAVVADRSRPNPVDSLGDPLPKHATMRLGSVRFCNGTSVGRVLYTPDGKFLVTCGSSVVRIWDADTGRIIRDIGDSRIGFRDVALSPDGAALATIEYPTRLRVWELATGRERRQWHEAKNENYACVSFSPHGQTIALASTRYGPVANTHECFVDLWDTATPTERRRRIVADWQVLQDLKFSPDGKTLVTASDDREFDSKSQTLGPEKGSTRLWELATGRERKRFAVENAHAQSLAVSPDGRFVASAVTDGTIRLYDLAAGPERTLRLGKASVRPAADFGKAAAGRAEVMSCLAFSPDGSTLASGSSGTGTTGSAALADIYLWDIHHGKELRHFGAHQGWIESLAFSPGGETLASGGPEPAARLWNVATGHEVLPRPGHRSGIRALVVSPADGTVITGSVDGTIRRWDLAAGRELGVVAALPTPADTLAISPDGKNLLVGGSLGGRFALWSIADRQEIRSFPRVEPRNPVRHLAFSPDGTTVASERRIWDAATGRVLVGFRDQDALNNANASFFPIFYSADGKQLITTENEGARVWDIATGREARWAVRAKILHDRVALSANRRFLATGGVVGHSSGGPVDPLIHVWDLASGKEVATLAGHEESTNGLAFSPNGRLLASGSGDYRSSNDATVRVWDLTTARELRRCEGHRGAVNAVAFTPDGRSVISASEDATALVWDVSDLHDAR